MLRHGRVQAAIMFDEVAAYHLQQMRLPTNSIRQGPLNHVSDIYVAFSPSRPSAREAMLRLDKGLRLLRNAPSLHP